jgi:hypothetical protein
MKSVFCNGLSEVPASSNSFGQSLEDTQSFTGGTPLHEFNLSANALRAMQLFVSKRAGSTDTNPNSALHLRYLNDTSIRITCTNGQVIAIARLLTKSEQLESFYWPE